MRQVYAGLFPPALVHRLRVEAERWHAGGKFWGIHSLREGDIGRVVLYATPKHLQQMRKNGEFSCFIGDSKAGRALVKDLRPFIAKCPVMGPAGRRLECLEILMSMPGSKGQALHKDVWGEEGDDIMNCAVNLNGDENQTTVFPIYHCEKFPACVKPGSREPLDWDSLPKGKVFWGFGETIAWYPWVIHGAPPNKSKQNARFILFWNTESSVGSFTDAEVITEAVFRDEREQWKV